MLSKFKNKKILILGLAREGLSTYKFLKKHCPEAKIFVSDQCNLSSKYKNFIKTNNLKNYNFDFIFKSPGISLNNFKKLNLKYKNLQSNSNLFFNIVKSVETQNFASLPITIGVTGTKGKTTTTSLIYHILKQSGLDTKLGGNIGVSPLDLLSGDIDKKIFVLEISSHQLQNLQYSPSIAVIQDIVPDHLDYYLNFKNYFQAKTAITKYQNKNNLVIYNQESKTASKLASLSKAKKIKFSLNNKNLIKLIKDSPTPLLGQHNLLNSMPAVLIAKYFKIPDKKIQAAIKTFKPVEHRLEFVKKINNIKFYNDSASSAPEATVAALKAFPNQNLILIAGGSVKDVKFDKLAKQILKSKIKYLILFKDTGIDILNNIKKLNNKFNKYKFAKNMPEAVKLTFNQANSGDVVLLSPGSASFNMFKDYEDRGKQFKRAVKKL